MAQKALGATVMVCAVPGGRADFVGEDSSPIELTRFTRVRQVAHGHLLSDMCHVEEPTIFGYGYETVFIGMVVLTFILTALGFLFLWVYVDRYTRKHMQSGNGTNEDFGMGDWRKAGGSSDGGDSKRGGDRRDGAEREWDDLTHQRDERTPDEFEEDRRRRLDTQCIFIGWFEPADADYRSRTGWRFQYRQCRSNAGTATAPWCKMHYLKRHDSRDNNPNRSEKKKKDEAKKKGLGSGRREDLDRYDKDRPTTA